MVWYKKLGFYNNPFSIKPAAYHNDLLGCEEAISEATYNILTGKVSFVQGDYGEGKTTLLKRLINEFGGKKEVIYYSCNRIEKNLDIENLLRGRYGILGKIFAIKPKNMILLLDEAQDLTINDCEKIQKYYQQGYFKSIIFVGKIFDKEKFATLKPFVIKLNKISCDDAAKLIRTRIGSLPLLPDETIKYVYEKSNNNIRELLKNCEEVCKHAVETGEENVTQEIVKEVLNIKAEKAKEKIKAETPKKAEEKAKEKVKAETPKKEVKEGTVEKAEARRVFTPEEYKRVSVTPIEEALNKQPEEIITEEQYY